MKKNTTRLLLIGILVLLLALDFFGANYLVSFAIGRTTSGGASVVPKPVTTDEAKNTVDENYKIITEQTKQWLETAEPETVSITSRDGLALEADVYITNPESTRWAILIHGYTARRTMMRDYGRLYAAQGYNLLMPDLRGHGGSEGQYIGMGWPDRLDVLQWIDYIIAQNSDAQIILHGVSMGGATVLMTSGEALPGNVKAIVEDCGYTSVWDIFSDEMKVLFHLPDFPLLHTASMIATYRAGYNFTEASALNQVGKAQVPILFIHGSKDNFVHTEMVYTLYDACPSEKEILVVEEAGHGQSYYYAPEMYEAKIFDFLTDKIT